MQPSLQYEPFTVSQQILAMQSHIWELILLLTGLESSFKGPAHVLIANKFLLSFLDSGMAAVWLRGKARLNTSWQRAKTQTLRAVRANQRFIFSQMMDLLNLTCCISPGAVCGRECAVTSFMAYLQRTSRPFKCDKQQAFPAACCEAVENVIRESCCFYLGTFVKCNERDLEQECAFARDKEKNSFLLVCSTKPQGPVLFLHLAKYVQFLSSKQTRFYARLLRSQILCAQNAQRRWFCLHPKSLSDTVIPAPMFFSQGATQNEMQANKKHVFAKGADQKVLSRSIPLRSRVNWHTWVRASTHDVFRPFSMCDHKRCNFAYSMMSCFLEPWLRLSLNRLACLLTWQHKLLCIRRPPTLLLALKRKIWFKFRPVFCFLSDTWSHSSDNIVLQLHFSG